MTEVSQQAGLEESLINMHPHHDYVAGCVLSYGYESSISCFVYGRIRAVKLYFCLL